MLKSLRIQNLALIDDLTLEFGEGLNLLTGETGSGKSIIVDSVGFILGKRSGAEIIRSGEESARVEAVMDVSGEVRRRVEESGITADGDEPMVLRRELSRSGKSRAWVNQSPVTVGFLQGLAPLLADIHGQHDQRLLQQPGLHIDLLDDFAGNGQDRLALEKVYRRMSQLKSEMAAADIAENERSRRLDFLHFQIREIEEARLRPEEEELLLRERNLLSHAEELLRLSREIYEWIYNLDESALSLLSRSARNLQRLASIDSSLQTLEAAAESARFSLEEIGRQMRDYSEAIEFDPERLQQVELRLDRLETLKRKYGASIAGILDLLNKLTAEHCQLAGWEENRSRLAAECSQVEAEYRKLAGTLSENRKQAAVRMQKAMETELKSLAMERSRFFVHMDVRLADPAPTGLDRVEFLLAPNPGEEPRPLAKIASGGELSRLMLALKTVLRAGGGELLVFDEVDAGIGGRVAETVGQKLKKLASRQQVFCVTHLPQIAAFGDIHYCVEKESRKDRTVVTVERLGAEGKLREVARMLAGSIIGQSALEHARDLIARSNVTAKTAKHVKII